MRGISRFWPILFLAGACQPKGNAEGESCLVSADCEAGLICYYQQCRSRGTAAGLLYAVVTPPASSGYPAWQYSRPLDPVAAAEYQIDLPVPRHCHVGLKEINHGYWRVSGNNSNYITNIDGYLQPDGASDSFAEAYFYPGQYTLTFWPEERNLPSYIAAINVADGDSWSFTYPHDSLAEYSGYLQWEASMASPVEGAEVTAIDSEGRYCGRVQSNPDGSYRLQCYEGSSLTNLLFAAGAQNPLVPDMDISLPGTSSVYLPITTISDNMPLSYQLIGQVIDGQSEGIGGARVSLLETMGQGSFRNSAYTTSLGYFSMMVWGDQPAVITINAAEKGRHLSYFLLPAAETADRLLFKLEPPYLVGGKIIDSYGLHYQSGSRVTAVPSRDPAADPDGMYRHYSAVADEYGNYELLLPSGEYVVTVDPPADSGQAVGRYGLRVNGPRVIDWQLPRPYLLEGTVTMDGKVLAQARVEIYLPLWQSAGQPQLVGKTVSDKEGHFSLAVAAY